MSAAQPKSNSLRMMDYSAQDSLRVGKNGFWGPHKNERRDFTPRQLRRIAKKSRRTAKR